MRHAVTPPKLPDSVMALDKDDLSSLIPYWKGEWHLDRNIPENHATMTGRAWFTDAQDATALDYHENVQLTLHGQQQMEATRRYRFQCHADNIAIHFADGVNDGKLFQNLRLTDAAMSNRIVLVGRHLCVADLYDTSYEINDADSFTAIHSVYGPAKQYISTTVYHRISQTL